MKSKTKRRIAGCLFWLSLAFLLGIVGGITFERLTLGTGVALMAADMIVCAVAGCKSGVLR